MIRIPFVFLIAGLLVAPGSAAAPCAGHDDGSCSTVEHDSSTLLQSKVNIGKLGAVEGDGLDFSPEDVKHKAKDEDKALNPTEAALKIRTNRTKVVQVNRSDEERRNDGVVFITGTGRSGTTFLMELFTHLGLPTGFNASAVSTVMKSFAHGGLESRVSPDDCKDPRSFFERLFTEPSATKIFKSPFFAQSHMLPFWLTKVSKVIVPIRNVHEAALSRARNQFNGFEKQGGFFLNATNSNEMTAANADLLSVLMAAIAESDVDVTYLSYPKLVKDANYLHSKLQWLCERFHVSKERFVKAHEAIVRPSLVHTYGNNSQR